MKKEFWPKSAAKYMEKTKETKNEKIARLEKRVEELEEEIAGIKRRQFEKEIEPLMK